MKLEVDPRFSVAIIVLVVIILLLGGYTINKIKIGEFEVGFDPPTKSTLAPPTEPGTSPERPSPPTSVPTTSVPEPAADGGSMLPEELAFVSDRGQSGPVFQAYVIDPDHPDPQNYQPFSANPPGYEVVFWPSFCDRRLIVEAQDNEKQNPQWTYILDNLSIPSRLGVGIGIEQGQPNCSPDGKYVSFTAYNPNTNKWDTLVVADIFNNSVVFTNSYQGNMIGRTSWPDSMQSMLFPVLTDRKNLIWSFYLLRNFATTSSTVQTLFQTGSSPALSPDGQQVAYMCPDTNKDFAKLCVGDINNGTVRELITTDTSHDKGFKVWVTSVTPEWSSDGQWIYYLDYEGGDYDIFRISPDGSMKENVTRNWLSNEFMPALK